MPDQQKMLAGIPTGNESLPKISPDNNKDIRDVVDSLNVLSRWECSDKAIKELLGFKCEEACLEMLLNPSGYEFTSDQLIRMRYIINIDRALNILLPNASADSWVHRPNHAPIFKGIPAIELMRSGTIDDLRAISEYLYGNILF